MYIEKGLAHLCNNMYSGYFGIMSIPQYENNYILMTFSI